MNPPQPLLCLVVDRATSRRPLREAVALAVAAGVDWIQIRDRELEGAALLAWARILVDSARRAEPDVRVIVNRRIDVALSLEADGAHLGFDALDVASARRLLGPNSRIGVSAHHPDEVAAAAEAGANYAHLAPIFDPLSKPVHRPAIGLSALRAASKYGIPVIAQGGIDATRCAAVLEAGASGVAVTGAVLSADDPAAASAALREALK